MSARKQFRASGKLQLAKIDPGGHNGWEKEPTQARLVELNLRLQNLQEILWAQRQHKLLVVLQATDTAGKDSTIRRVFDGVDPSGVRVAAFKRPTDEELAHDYLWRVHEHTPGNGELVIFNRSHYEDVLVVRVHGFVPEERWRRRFGHIRDFERLLADEGTTIIKIFLHISKDEQRKRLQQRLDDPTKHWKFASGDLAERELWDLYQAAFEDAIRETDADHAPWYVIPANHKWFRDRAVLEILVETLESLDLAYPPPSEDLSGLTTIE